MKYPSELTKQSLIKALIQLYPDFLESAFKIACEFKQPSYSRGWDLGGVYKMPRACELRVECGPHNDIVNDNSGYWTIVKLNIINFNGDGQLRIGGIWGAPVSEFLQGVISVETLSLRDFLVSRGWTLRRNGKDHVCREEILLSPPGVEMVSQEYLRWSHVQKQDLAQLSLDRLDNLITWVNEERLVRSLESL